MMFADRLDAARQLAARLSAFKGTHPLVLAIPRGAVPMARVIADELGGDLDVVLVKKLGAPDNPELAVGAVEESGWFTVAEYAGDVGATAEYLTREAARQLGTLRARRARYTPHRPSLDARGRVVLVVDDGLATGATMLAALHAVRTRGPARLVCAVPVASEDGLARVRHAVDAVVCLDTPPGFRAVGQFYRAFDAVEDDEVVRTLNERRAA
jgi:predicted phosphoribosyltransferase